MARRSSPARSSAPSAARRPASATPTAPRPPPRETPPPRHAPIAERRLVSILFADLVGFTTLAEGRDAEETRELLSRYFELAGEVIGRYGGTIEKFIGDAVMAVWGTPIARENDAERAVRAALDVVAAVKTLGPGISARAGVLTGEAAVTLGATNQGMVAGDLVNTASRLQSVAQPGTVLVGESTERAANQAIAFEPAGEQVLKGKEAPVPAFRAIRVVAERGGRGRGDQLEAPFLGRDGEFGLLKDLFHATGRERRTRIVSIVGVAGSGKSRLVWELSKYLDGVVESVLWHTGRSPAYGEGITFWALGEMVRTRAGLAETDDEPTTRVKIAETVERWVPDESERRWIESALLVLLGVDTATQMAREELFSAWRTFFERIAAEATVALVFEDLHWADPGTLDFIDELVEWSRGVPILVITVARPELFEHRPDWGAGRRNFMALGLEPLPESAIRELLTELVPGLPDAPLRAIAERADGIPLYAVETIRMLVAEGRLAPVDGGYVPSGDLTNLSVPETLHALIAARLDALPAPERALIQDAAVLGQSFTVDGLAAVSGQDRAQVRGALPGAHEAGTARPERRPAVGRAWPGGVRPGAHPRGRLRHAVAARSSIAPPGCGPVLRVIGRGGAGRRARIALSGGVSRGAGRSGQPATGGAGEDRPPGRRVPCELAWQPRPGSAIPGRGGRGHRRPRRDRGAPRAGRGGRRPRRRHRTSRNAAARCDRAPRGVGRSLGCGARDRAARAGPRQRLASRGCGSSCSNRPSTPTATSWTTQRSRRSSTSSRGRTGSTTTRCGRSNSPIAQSVARSASRPSSWSPTP